MSAGHHHEFRVAIQFKLADDGDDRPVVLVVGEVTSLTAPTILAVVAGLADQGHRHLVLELGGVSFMDVSGIRIMDDLGAHLAKTHGSLAVRSASEQVRRVLAIADPVPNVVVEPAYPGLRTLAGDPVDVTAAPEGGRPRALSSDLLKLGTHPTAEIVDAALRALTQLASASLAGADGASLTLERNGRLATVAATDGMVLRVDAHQYNTGEGPCLAAGAHGRSFYVESLTHEARWPTFVPRAVEEGIGSILAAPLMLATQTIGALNLYSRRERSFGTDQRALAETFAAEASTIVATGVTVVDNHLSEKIARALRSRETIALARGVLMARAHVNADEAAGMLIRSARASEITVLQHATEIVAIASGDPRPGHQAAHHG
ncbi:MAG: GAF domain-containing protein [Ilumatobacteraceae bacterium]